MSEVKEPSIGNEGAIAESMKNLSESLEKLDEGNPDTAPDSSLNDEKKETPIKQEQEKLAVENKDDKPDLSKNIPAKVEKIEDVVLSKEKEAEISNLKAEDFLKEEDTVKESEETLALRKKVEQYESTFSDPEALAAMKIAQEAKKQGKTIVEYINEISGVDPNKLSARELFERKLKSYPELTEDERTEEMAKFDGMSKLQQLERTKDVKNEMLNSRNNILEQYAVKSTDKEEKFKQIVYQESVKATEELEDLLGEKEYKNLELTPERKRAIKKHVNQHLKHDEKGMFNVRLGVNTAIMALYEKEFEDANRSVVKTKEREKIFKEMTRPSKETISTSFAPAQSEEEELREALRENSEKQQRKHELTV